MGSKNSKSDENEELKKRGEEANKKSGNYEYINNENYSINLTNDVIVSLSNKDPWDDYICLNLIVKESSTSVYCVKSKITGLKRAMKTINKIVSYYSDEDEKEIINEINILRILDHPNILRIFEFYISNDSYTLVTELCQGGELFYEIKNKGPFNEEYSAYVMYQILFAINYCHKMKIIHRNLKPENIFILERDINNFPRIKIADFRSSKIFEEGEIHKDIAGSSYYIAPEVLNKNYNEKCDLWSCGVIMYILLSGRPPFEGNNDFDIIKNIKKGKYDLESKPFDKLSNSGLDLIKKLLEIEPDKRLSASEALEHSWFKENKSKELYNNIYNKNILIKMINNLKKYKRNSIIQETALAYLIHNFPQIKGVINACKLFNQIDVDSDGKINKEELYNGLKSKIKSNTLKQDIDIIFKNIDMDNNGYIEYEEFVRGAISKEYFMDNRIIKFAFRYFDKDGSGKITYDEIEEVFQNSISDKTKVSESLKKIIAEVDTNGDGIISFSEFSNIMKKMLV